VHAADADHEQDRAPGERKVEEPAEGAVAGPPVGATGAEEVLAVDQDPDRPEREERERERRTREGEHAPRPPIAAEAAETARRSVQEPAAEPVHGDRVDQAAEEGPDSDFRGRDARLVQELARNRRAEDTGDSRQPGNRQQRLLPRVDRLIRLVSQRNEDGARRNKHRRRAQPPAPLERRRACSLDRHLGGA
jgi:hypothetical protein